MIIAGRELKAKLDRWSWRNTGGLERFGGGWKYKLGIDIGTRTIILNLIWGMVRISFAKVKK